MKIQGKKITLPDDFLDLVTYVPVHANGNAGHKDCQPGVIVSIAEPVTVMVLYCHSRRTAATNPDLLVWG